MATQSRDDFLYACPAPEGFDISEVYSRIAGEIDEILKGTKPGNIPFYQASKFVLVINLKTADALGLTMPPSLLVQANEVIE